MRGISSRIEPLNWGRPWRRRYGSDILCPQCWLLHSLRSFHNQYWGLLKGQPSAVGRKDGVACPQCWLLHSLRSFHNQYWGLLKGQPSAARRKDGVACPQCWLLHSLRSFRHQYWGLLKGQPSAATHIVRILPITMLVILVRDFIK